MAPNSFESQRSNTVRRLPHSALYLLLILASAAFWLSLSRTGLLHGLEEQTIRWRYLARGEAAPADNLRYVDLDARTVSYMGDRPWDRREFGRLMEALLGPGEARVVCLDIILSKFGGGALLDFERARKGDHFLGQVIRRYPERIVLAAGYTGVGTARGSGETAYLPLIREDRYHPEMNPFPEAPTFPIINFGLGRLGLANVDEGLSRGAVPYWVPGFVALRGDAYSQHLLDGVGRYFYKVLNEPRLVFGEATIRLEDKDGWAPQTYPIQSEQRLLSLGLETFLASRGLNASNVRRSKDQLQIVKDGTVLRRLPLFKGQSLEVNWLNGWNERRDNRRVSMRDVLTQADALAKAEAAGDRATKKTVLEWFARFRDQVIFVGAVDPLLKDLAPTPYNASPVPKVALHANLYRTIEEEAFIQRPGAWLEWLAVVVLTSLVSLLSLGSWLGRVASFAVLGAYLSCAFLAFSLGSIVLPLSAPVGSAVTAAFTLLSVKLGSVQMQRRRIKSLFSAYVAPSLVDQMVDARHDPELGGTEAEVTALFSDMEGFSAIAEELTAGRLVGLMNEYLGGMTEAFQAQQGTLDKYIGDAVVTMFGMPYPVTDHAARACQSAIAMQKRHAELREKWAASGDWPERVRHMRTRIGLNTGMAVIGNMGSQLRFNYTMMGDSVNLAARCESMAKRYGVYTMLSEATCEAARRDMPELYCRQLDRIVVPGRRQPVAIYELWDETYPQADAAACWERYESALKAYFEGDWAAALAGFEDAAPYEPFRGLAPTTPSEVLAARCRGFLRNGAPVNWDGVYRMG